LTDLIQLQQSAPPEIEAQVARLVPIVEELTMSRDPNRAADLVFARHQADLHGITDAGRAVERYTAEYCQLTLNPIAAAPSKSQAAPGPPVPTPAPSGR
jgi:hypothetical protein